MSEHGRAAEIAQRYGVTKPNGKVNGSPAYKIPEVCHDSPNGKKDLKIWEGDGGSIGARCWSRGCSYQSILDALGVEFTYEGRKHYYGNDNTAPVFRKRGPDKDLGGNPGTNKGLLVKLDAADTPEKQVVLVEGEKAFDALAAYGSKNYTAAHWVGGMFSVEHADYSPLKDRTVILWPDAHGDGREAMGKAAACLRGIAKELKLVDTSALPDKADAADVEGPTIKELLDAVEDCPFPDVETPQTRLLSEGGQLQFTRDAEGLDTALLNAVRLEIRRNARGGRIEVRRTDCGTVQAIAFETAAGLKPNPTGWAHLQDGPAAYLRNWFSRSVRDPQGKLYKLSQEKWNEAILALTAGRSVDPVIDWLESLPAWDGKERIPAMFVEALGADDTPLNRATAIAFMVGGVRRPYRPGCQHDWAPILTGAQGAGKSTFCKELTPPEYRWHTSIASLENERQRQSENVDTAWIVEFEEFNVRGENSSIKSFISSYKDTYRRPYEKSTSDTERSWVGIGTTNDYGTGVLPDDSTGHRRYVAIAINPPGSTREKQSALVRAYLDKNRAQLWAEALVRERRGEKNYLGGEFEAMQDEVNAQYAKANSPLEEIAGRLTADHADGSPVTIGSLLIESGLAFDEKAAEGMFETTGAKLAGFLKKLHWQKKRETIDGVRASYWRPPSHVAPAPPSGNTKSGPLLPYRDDNCPVCGVEQMPLEGADWMERQKAHHLAWRVLVLLRQGMEVDRAMLELLLPYANHQDDNHKDYESRRDGEARAQAWERLGEARPAEIPDGTAPTVGLRRAGSAVHRAVRPHVGGCMMDA